MSRLLMRPVHLLLLSLVFGFAASCSSAPGSKDDYPRPESPSLSANAHNGFVTLSWPAVNNATGYRIYWSTTSGGTRDMSNYTSRTELSFLHVGLENGQTYYYAVTATTEFRESEKSQEVSATPLFPPSAPLNVRAVLVGGVATVAWDAVSNAQRYNVYMASETGIGASIYATLVDGKKGETAGTALAFSNLDETKNYYFTITATNIHGDDGTESVTVTAAPVTVAIAAGANHSCAIRPDRTLVCWGANDSGQLGLGNKVPSFSPMKVDDQSWHQVTAGGNHTCAINTDGKLFCWGQNTYGQLGSSDQFNKSIPAQIGADRNWQNVSAGVDHTCAVKTDHTLWCWGSNQYGQLALGEINRVNEPKEIYLEQTWNTVSAGNHHTCAVQQNGSLKCWGENTSGQLGNGGSPSNATLGKDPQWTAVAVGGEHSCALKTDTSLWCWGHNSFGQLGNGISGKEPNNIPQIVDKNEHWISVKLGKEHSCAMRIDGQLFCWGANFKGQLNDSTVKTQNFPEEVLSGPSWRTAALGNLHTCALADDGTFRCWGDNENGQLGKGSPINRSTPASVPLAGEWRSVVAGWYHTCAIKIDDSLWCWGGSNTQGVSPIQSASSSGWINVALAHFRACALRGDDTLWCTRMGYGQRPQFGFGGEFGGGEKWSEVVITDKRTCALRKDRTIWCWSETYDSQVPALDARPVWKAIALNSDGLCAIMIDDGSRWCEQNGSAGLALMDNSVQLKTLTQDGQCGIKSDDTMKCIVPTGFAAKDTWMKISSNLGGICAIKNDRSLWCRGSRIGPENDNTWDDISVSDDSPADFNPYGYAYYCGVKTDHTLWCWGEAHYGQLGKDGLEKSDIPVSVQNDSAWIWNAISTGGHHTCAIGNNNASKADRRLHCWGKNNYGQLGIGSTESMSKPEPVDTASKWSSITTGAYHTCGIKISDGATTGTLWCWGANGYGQLGTNPYEEKLVDPTRVVEDSDWISVIAGDYHTCALKSSGTLWCWGFNAYGQIGNGSTEKILGLTQIELPGLPAWKTVTAGEHHTCAITVAEKLYCWGENYNGQLGVGDTKNRLTPTPITVDSTRAWIAVAAGSQHTCAIPANGDLWCWGDHQFGQLAYGDDQNIRRLLPTVSIDASVPNSAISKVAAGSNHTCVVYRDNDGVWCSGANGFGQLGDGTTLSKSSLVPSAIADKILPWDPQKMVVSAGGRHTCALRENTLLCWGDNTDGQVGNP